MTQTPSLHSNYSLQKEDKETTTKCVIIITIINKTNKTKTSPIKAPNLCKKTF